MQRKAAGRGAFVPLAALLIVASGCLGGDEPGTGSDGPTSAECLEQGLILNESAPGGPACEPPPFEIRDFEDPRHHCVVTEQRDRVHAPDLVGDPWVLGQYWDHSLAVDGEELGTTRLVYYDDQDLDPDGRPQHYMVGTPTREEALRHAVLSENPMVGRVHRVLYSPHESGDHADMFHFPLCDGSTWTTMFYGETFTLTARDASIDVPDQGPGPGFVISGTSAEGGNLELSYAPAAQWFTYIDLTRADGGTVDMRLVEIGQGATGAAFFLRGQQDAEVSLNGSTPVPLFSGTLADAPLMREDGAEGPYDTIGFAASARLVGQGMATVELIDPAGAVAWSASLGGQEPTSVEVLEEVPYQAGEWIVRLNGFALDPGAASVEVDLQAVSIYDRSGEV